MAMLSLALSGNPVPVPKRSLFKLLERHHESFQPTRRAVQGLVRREVLEQEIAEQKREFDDICLDVARLTNRLRELESQQISLARASHRLVEIPMNDAKHRDGIMSYLTVMSEKAYGR